MKLFLSILFIATTLLSTAQTKEMTATVNKSKVAKGERLKITFTARNISGESELPDLSDFRILQGPYREDGVEMVSNNGKMVYDRKIAYSYIIEAKSIGVFTIGKAKITTTDNKVYESKPIKITVIKKGTAAQSQNENFFLKIVINRNNVYQGEEITATYYLYARLDIVNRIRVNNIKIIDDTGFWTHGQPIRNIPWEENDIKVINGQRYIYGIAMHKTIIPLHHGKLQLEPFDADLITRTYRGNIKKHIISNTPKITVKALPQPQPDDFIGAVGDYSISITQDVFNGKENDPISIKIKVKGEGNLKVIDEIKIPFPNDFEVYDPEIKEDIDVTNSGVSGSKTYEFLVIPRHAGKYTVGPISFSSFNPKTGKYVTLCNEMLEFNIAEGEGNQASNNGTYTGANKDEVDVLSNDIRHIGTNFSDRTDKDTYFYGSAGFIAGIVSPILLFFALFFGKRTLAERNKDTLTRRSKKATTIAIKKLSGAKKHMDNNNHDAFFEEIAKATNGYISDKLHISKSQLNKENILTHLKAVNVPEDVITNFMKVVENCEIARFSPNKVEMELETYEEAIFVIKSLEGHLKK